MLHYLVPVLGLVLLCMFWGLFQLWLRRVDPDGRREDDHCSTCGGCSAKSKKGREESSTR